VQITVNAENHEISVLLFLAAQCRRSSICSRICFASSVASVMATVRGQGLSLTS